MRHAKKWHSNTRKVMAMLLALVMLLTLPATVSAREPGEVPESANLVETPGLWGRNIYIDGDMRQATLQSNDLQRYVPSLVLTRWGEVIEEFTAIYTSTSSTIYKSGIADAFGSLTFGVWLYETSVDRTKMAWFCVTGCDFRGGIGIGIDNIEVHPCWDDNENSVIYLPLTEPGVIIFTAGGFHLPLVIIVEGDFIAPMTTVASLLDPPTNNNEAPSEEPPATTPPVTTPPATTSPVTATPAGAALSFPIDRPSDVNAAPLMMDNLVNLRGLQEILGGTVTVAPSAASGRNVTTFTLPRTIGGNAVIQIYQGEATVTLAGVSVTPGTFGVVRAEGSWYVMLIGLPSLLGLSGTVDGASLQLRTL